MAATRTLAELRTEARQRADMETDDSFVADTELTRMINQSIRELYDLLLESYGHEFYYTTGTLSIVAGTSAYNLPTTFYQLLGADLDLGGGEYMELSPFTFLDRNQGVAGFGWGYPDGPQYRIMGSQIHFRPTPVASATVLLHYIPYPTSLSADGDTFDGINGWEEYVVVDVAAKMLEKEESDAAPLYKRKLELQQRIQSQASKRNAAFPDQVTNIYRPTWRYF